VTFLAFLGEHPILTVIILVVLFAGTRDLIVAWRGTEEEPREGEGKGQDD
jgi:hypothetical protein